MIERRSRALFRLSPTPQRSIEVLRLCARVSQSRQVMTIKCLLTEYRTHVGGGSDGTFRYFRNRVPVRENQPTRLMLRKSSETALIFFSR